MFYLNNWRGDVVAMVTSTGYQAEMVRYSPYGTPFGYPGGDCNEDGAATGADRTVINGWISASTYDVRGDLDLDGDVDSTDSVLFAANYTGTTTGRGVLSAGGNEIGYAGMMWFESGRYLARHRWHDPELGRWGRRDPLGYVDGLNVLIYCPPSPVLHTDPYGLDAPGCDTVPGGVQTLCVLACCAIHDECYDKNHCTETSWLTYNAQHMLPGFLQTDCHKCNEKVKSCIRKCAIDRLNPFPWPKPTPTDPGKYYYCARLHKYITICQLPLQCDYVNLAEATLACDSDPEPKLNLESKPAFEL